MIARRLLTAGSFAVAGLLAGCNRAEMHRPLVAVIIPSQDNPFFKAEGDSAAARARALGYRVRVDAHNDDAYRQDNLVDAAIASGASILILDNAGAEASVAVVRRASQAGVLCFLIDREIDATGFAKAQIIADNHQGAHDVAAEFARALTAQSGAGPKAYAELLGRESDTNAQVRTQGFHAVLDKTPGVKMVAAQSANWSQAEAFARTETMLQAHAELRGIIAGNDTMALGAAAAVKGAGLHNIIITGFDGSPDAIAAIRSGELDATMLQPAAVIAELAVNEADQLRRTGSTGKPERQVIACDLVTRTNAADYSGFRKIR